MSIENLIRPQGHVNSEVTDPIRREFKLVRDFVPVLCLSSLPASLKNLIKGGDMVFPIISQWALSVASLAWRQHFPIISLWENFLDAQGQLTP